MTKDILSYADVKQQLMYSDTPESDDDSAPFVSKPSGNKKKGKKPVKSGNDNCSASSSTSKVCPCAKSISLESPKDIPRMKVFGYTR